MQPRGYSIPRNYHFSVDNWGGMGGLVGRTYVEEGMQGIHREVFLDKLHLRHVAVQTALMSSSRDQRSRDFGYGGDG
jgi:hypothetical protein